MGEFLRGGSLLGAVFSAVTFAHISALTLDWGYLCPVALNRHSGASGASRGQQTGLAARWLLPLGVSGPFSFPDGCFSALGRSGGTVGLLALYGGGFLWCWKQFSGFVVLLGISCLFRGFRYSGQGYYLIKFCFF